MDIETTSRELKLLAERETLSHAELVKAKKLMVDLKSMGMSNPEIVELNQNRWSESTVKEYTGGIKAKRPERWQSTASLLSELLSDGLTLADVRQAMAINNEIVKNHKTFSDVIALMNSLDDKKVDLEQVAQTIKLSAELNSLGISFKEIAALNSKLKEEDIDLTAFISTFRKWDKAGLTPVDAQSVLKCKAQLDRAGINIEGLSQVAEAAGKFGGVNHIMEAIDKYGSIETLNNTLQTKQGELKALDAEINNGNKKVINAGQELEKVKTETADIKNELAVYKKIKAIGFDEKALGELKKAADKYGGPGAVLNAINSFTAVSDIKASLVNVESKVKKQEEENEHLKNKYSHLQAAVDICQKLMEDYKLSPDAIAAILSTARKFGKPGDIFKALEAYGKIEAVNEDYTKMMLAVIKIEAEVEELKKTQEQYEAKTRISLNQFEALNAKAIEVGRAVGIAEEQIKKNSGAREILSLLQNPAAVAYEDSLSLVHVLLKSIRLWAIMNKNKFSAFSPLENNLESALRQLGGT